jgi:hypothetical protein
MPIRLETLKKYAPHIGAGLIGAGAGAAGGAYLGSKSGQKKGLKKGRKQGVAAASAHFRRGSRVRNRALQVFAIRNQQLSRQNQALRARIGVIASSRKKGQ